MGVSVEVGRTGVFVRVGGMGVFVRVGGRLVFVGVGDNFLFIVGVGEAGVSVGVAGSSQSLFRMLKSPWPATKCPSFAVKSAQISSGWFPCPCVIHLLTELTLTVMETYLPDAAQWQMLTLSAADACCVRNRFNINEAIRNAPLRIKAKLPSCLKIRRAFIPFFQQKMGAMDLTAPG